MASLMRRGRKGAEDAIEAAGGDARDLFRTKEDEGSIASFFEGPNPIIPREHHDRVWDCARHMCNSAFTAMAAAAGALIAEQAYEANSSFGMWAAFDTTASTPLGRGANVIPGHIYNFLAFRGGALLTGANNSGGPGVVSFTKGQRFFGLVTGSMDSNNGWSFVGNTVMLASDAISGIETDTSFAGWTPAVVKARLIKGEYEGFAIKTETVIPFNASGYVPVGMPAVPSIEGLTIQFFDARCLNKELTFLDLEEMSFEEMVRELVEHIAAGRISRKLMEEYVPANRRRYGRP